MKYLLSMLFGLMLVPGTLAQSRSTSEAKTPTIIEKVAGMQKYPGPTTRKCD